MISDKEMCDFLYSILTQLEVRNVNWERIASEHGISNAHAARMRWHRFKAGREPGDVKKRKRKNGEKTPLGKEGKKGEGMKGMVTKAAAFKLSQQKKCIDDDDEEFMNESPLKRERLEENILDQAANAGIKFEEKTVDLKQERELFDTIKVEPLGMKAKVIADVKVKLQDQEEALPYQLQGWRREKIVDLTQEDEPLTTL
ncbi:hypothetical protein NA57DRAFT_81007 [Rhizodiscina lignyota]|uniref:Myb-like DNA-binding domain-containing protein n=1 Tax=Rhizodiscina lignyota TaxID=1504668 RepID=A0A9P4I543_9PEZI|nr:hypothetical protein NA57DRAFT_81007 [Rhizodiscina lignyota]